MITHDIEKALHEKFFVRLFNKDDAEQLMSILLENEYFKTDASVTFNAFRRGKNVWPEHGKNLVVNKRHCGFANMHRVLTVTEVFYDDFLDFLQNESGDKMHVSSDEFSAAFAALIE